MDYKKILEDMLNGNKYYGEQDLRYNVKYKFKLSKNEYNEFIKFKESYESSLLRNLPLISFNSNKMFYYLSSELDDKIHCYSNYLDDNYSNGNIFDEEIDEIFLSLICSEIDGTLEIENVNTTRRQVLDIIKYKKNDIPNSKIINNMYEGLKFVLDKPIFNKENLKKLYEILSDGELNENDILHDKYYRDDMVTIDRYEGCPTSLICDAMDSLFNYINRDDKHGCFLDPFIAHYYILYIHPYFDFNGRCARMVGIWISALNDFISPVYISEAINDDKNNYYKAINKTRDSNNDLTYFLTYLVDLSDRYYMAYKNINEIKKDLFNRDYSLTTGEFHYLKKILLNSKNDWFNYGMFLKFSNSDMSKQASLKLLNSLLDKDLLISKISSSKEKLFKINGGVITYEL